MDGKKIREAEAESKFGPEFRGLVGLRPAKSYNGGLLSLPPERNVP